MPSGQKCREAQRATCEQEAKCNGTSFFLKPLHIFKLLSLWCLVRLYNFIETPISSSHLIIGISSECPASAPQPDGTECLEKGLCRNGTCLPFCETQGYQSCMCDTPADACKRCCRYHLNDTCFPFEPYDVLPDGTPCVHGFCNSGICEKTVQDIVERFWDIVEELSINRVLAVLKDNLVPNKLQITSFLAQNIKIFIFILRLELCSLFPFCCGYPLRVSSVL